MLCTGYGTLQALQGLLWGPSLAVPGAAHGPIGVVSAVTPAGGRTPRDVLFGS